MDTLFAVIIAVTIATFFVRRYLRNLKKKDDLARKIAEKTALHPEEPKGLHPHIDATYCIGCATCTAVCPEGEVLAMLGGKAVIANGHRRTWRVSVDQKCGERGTPLRRYHHS